jgi:hypothetical protein
MKYKTNNKATKKIKKTKRYKKKQEHYKQEKNKNITKHPKMEPPQRYTLLPLTLA